MAGAGLCQSASALKIFREPYPARRGAIHITLPHHTSAHGYAARISIRARGLFRAISLNRPVVFRSTDCFNPRPGFIPGDMPERALNKAGACVVSIRARGLFRAISRHGIVGRARRVVSIRARGLFRAISGSGHSAALCQCVSIRARGLFRAICGQQASPVMPHQFQSAPGVYSGRYLKLHQARTSVGQFQSAPGVYSGRYTDERSAAASRMGFNPRPGFIPGDISGAAGCEGSAGVSIRARGLFRAIRGYHRASGLRHQFQSAPGVYSGRYRRNRQPAQHAVCRFNPRPGFIPGDTKFLTVLEIRYFLFQSAPGVYSGRYLGYCAIARSCGQFQSAPGVYSGRYNGISKI